jgi:hypothetical protein
VKREGRSVAPRLPANDGLPADNGIWSIFRRKPVPDVMASWRLGEAKLRLDAKLRVTAKPCSAWTPCSAQTTTSRDGLRFVAENAIKQEPGRASDSAGTERALRSAYD